MYDFTRKIITAACIAAAVCAGALTARAGDDLESLGRLRRYVEAHPGDADSIKAAGYLALNLQQYDLGRSLGRRLVELGTQRGDRAGALLHGLILTGQTAVAGGEAERAYRALTQARAIAEKEADHNALSSVYNGLAMYETTFNADSYAAITDYYHALRHAKAAGNTRRYAIMLGNLSQAYVARNDLSGLEYAQQAYELAKRHGYSVPLYYATVGLAQYYTLDGRIDPAWDVLQEARHLASIQGRPDALELDLLEAYYRATTGRPDRAAAICREILDTRPGGLSARDSVQLLSALAGARLMEGLPRLALNDLDTARAIAKAHGLMFFWPKLLRQTSENLEAVGDSRGALEYLRLYSAFTDSMQHVSHERALVEERINHEVREQEELIRAHARQRADDRRRIVLLGVVCAALGAIAVMGWAFYRRRTRLYKAIVAQNQAALERENLLLQHCGGASAGGPDGADKPDPSDPSDTSGESVPSVNGTAPSPLMSRFTALMMQEKLFTDPSLTMAEVAARLGTNRTYLSRAVNENAGKAFPQVLTELRVREAIALMSRPGDDTPIKQVCAMAGFSALSTFYSAFQEATGMTPARYRAQLRAMAAE